MPSWVMITRSAISAPRLFIPGHASSSADVASAGFENTSNPFGMEHQEILHRAYSIWDSAGRPANRELDHWLQAEAEVLSERT